MRLKLVVDGRGEEEEEARGEGDGEGEGLGDGELAHGGVERGAAASGKPPKLGVIEPPPVDKAGGSTTLTATFVACTIVQATLPLSFSYVLS